jgi:hypothetical protein
LVSDRPRQGPGGRGGDAEIETPAYELKPGSNRMVVLNFRVSTAFKKAFKIAAATHGVTQSDLLQQVFDEWTQRQG